MHKPSTVYGGVKGRVGATGQTVATTKYSIGSSFENKTGDTYVAVTVKCDRAFDFYCFGDDEVMASTDAGVGGTGAKLLLAETGNPINGTATTGMGGKVFFVPIATMKYVLPVIYQAAGANALVTITYQTFND